VQIETPPTLARNARADSSSSCGGLLTTHSRFESSAGNRLHNVYELTEYLDHQAQLGALPEEFAPMIRHPAATGLPSGVATAQRCPGRETSPASNWSGNLER
jgi:hypothetical protein